MLCFLQYGKLPLWVMCGRLRFGKDCFEVDASWSGAVMCPALYEANFVKDVLTISHACLLRLTDQPMQYNMTFRRK